MKNIEKYKDELIRCTECKDLIELAGKHCGDFKPDVSECLKCRKEVVEWLLKEAKPTITTQEKSFLEIVKNGYIARDENDELALYEAKPSKSNWYWETEDGYVPLKENYFKFIKWTAEKPYSVEDLLKLEVKD